MTRKVLLLQSDPISARTLEHYFAKHGDVVFSFDDLAKARSSLLDGRVDLAIIDLHLPGNDWQDALRYVQAQSPTAGIILTNRHPDVRRELLAKERGIRVFLRAPYTTDWIDNAILKLERTVPLKPHQIRRDGDLPRVRVSMRAKITFPYALLALLFALSSSYLVSRYILESMRDRFMTQLIDTGKLSADWMVREEGRMLETLRLLANVDGMPAALAASDTVTLQSLTLPVAVNYQEDVIEILDIQGVSRLSLYKKAGGSAIDYEITQGDTILADQAFVQKSLHQKTDVLGDKFSGVVKLPSGGYFFIVGPILEPSGKLVGLVAVGRSLDALVANIRQDTLAQVIIYGLDGKTLASTLSFQGVDSTLEVSLVNLILLNQDQNSRVREHKIASVLYSEILGPWEVRGGEDLGVVGTSLAQNFFSRPSLITRLQVVLIVLMAVVGVIALGIFLANQITNPLSRVVQASIEVARGNLQVKVPSKGNDEVMVLAHAFNYMISGLQEGFIYRDLLGRTVSPEVREALRHSFASGQLRLEGQSAVATVLMSDIRGFTTLSEREQPTTILNWLNEYFGEIVPIITAHGGVVDKFEGDAVMAFFGILPQPLSPDESARAACHAALEIMQVIEKINQRRALRSEPSFVTGIGINTGSLIAGGLGASDRLNYTVIGDTVNTTQRIEGVSREFGDSGIVIGEGTLTALKNYRREFNFEPLGEHAFKGKRELIWLYRLYPLQSGVEVQVMAK